MEPLSTQPINAPDEYIKAPYEEYIHTATGLVTMHRTGITPPGYPNRAVYQIAPYEPGKQCYVFEAGHFWPAQEWREQAKADGRYGFPEPQTKKKIKKVFGKAKTLCPRCGHYVNPNISHLCKI